MLTKNRVQETHTDAMPSIAYARRRRWLGISAVGTIVTLSILSLTFALPSHFLSVQTSNVTCLTFELARCVFVFAILSLPFDLFGFNIERTYHRTSRTLKAFLASYVVALVKHSLALLVVALSIVGAYHAAGLTAVVLLSVATSTALIAFQHRIASWLADTDMTRVDSSPLGIPLFLVRNEERAFTGGIVGLPGSEAIVIPDWWYLQMTKSELEAEFTRRTAIIKSGGRTRGILSALLFSNVGVFLSAWLTTSIFALPLDCTAGIVTLSLLFTVWSFVGLLILPYFTHIGVYEADRLALDQGVNKELLLETITRIDSFVEGEQERTPTVDTIFHPVPTVHYRRLALDKTEQQGAWQLARYSVFISLTGLGLLGRAVHCNAGKPELWAMLPAD